MERKESSGRRHLRTLTLWVVVAMPFVLVGLAFTALTRAQQGVLRDWLWSVLVLCPLAVCLLPFYLLMLVLGQVAIPRAAAVRSKRLRQLREGGLVVQGRLREWSELLPPTHSESEEGPAAGVHKEGE